MAEPETQAEEKLYTLSEISQKTGISMPTLQRYKKLYQDRLPSSGQGRKQRYPESALPVFDEIKNENVGRRGRPRKDPSAPTQPYVFAQLSSDPRADRFVERGDALWRWTPSGCSRRRHWLYAHRRRRLYARPRNGRRRQTDGGDHHRDDFGVVHHHADRHRAGVALKLLTSSSPIRGEQA